MGEIDPTEEIDDQARKVVIVCGVRASDKHVYPLRVTDSGELIVDAEFTGDVIVDIDLPEAIDPALAITLPDINQHQLATKALKNGLTIKADKDNVGEVWIGDSGVAVGSSGLPLAAGESMPVFVDNANAVYYIGDQTGDTFYVVGG